MLFVVSGDVSFLEGPFLQILSLTHLYCCTLCILMWGCKPFLQSETLAGSLFLVQWGQRDTFDDEVHLSVLYFLCNFRLFKMSFATCIGYAITCY